MQDHPFWNYFISIGIDETKLEFFLDNPCPPDIIGFNYYITSERYLDENIKLYPDHLMAEMDSISMQILMP